MVRTVKKEMVNGSSRTTRSRAQNINEEQGAANTTQSSTQNINEERGTDDDSLPEDSAVGRRVLRSKYLSFKNRISDERDDMSKVDSDAFRTMIKEADNLHQLVQNPREQVADAEALFDITNTLVTSVKAYNNEGLTPAEFVSCLLRDFGIGGGTSSSQDEATSLIRWKDIGRTVSHVFRGAPGCLTMIGPMNTELKQRKNAVHRKRVRPTENERPEELDKSANKEKTDTDKNMATMFDILRRNRKVKLENLILNRKSFAQTVENLFALSFLVKDGRSHISVDDSGCHFVSPRNAPSASAIQSGDATYNHFMFRFDFRDWKAMLISVVDGDELMPHRTEADEAGNAQPDSEPEEAPASQPTTPIRKLCRNRGLVMQEQAVVADSPESDDTAAARAAAIRKGKRKLT